MADLPAPIRKVKCAADPSVPVPWRSAERLGIRPTIGIDFRKTRSLKGDWS
jgi:hypothetical protein